MTIMLDDYQQLVRQVESLRRRRDVAKGELKQLLLTLKKEFGVENIKQARRLLRKLEEEEREKAREYTEAKKAFEEEWADVLKDV